MSGRHVLDFLLWVLSGEDEEENVEIFFLYSWILLFMIDLPLGFARGRG